MLAIDESIDCDCEELNRCESDIEGFDDDLDWTPESEFKKMEGNAYTG